MIQNITANNNENYSGISRAFHMEGYQDVPIEHIAFHNFFISCEEYGVINYVKDIYFENGKISVLGKRDEKNDQYDNR